MIKSLYTPAESRQIINKVKDSKFFGSISRANNEIEVKNFVDKIKNKYNDATHNVTAYKLGSGSQALKYADDDGEPAGSSGPPVLKAIEGEGLTNTVIVVTRYFGGTKLGIGGLIRAYGNTARMVINEAQKETLYLHKKYRLTGNYDIIGTILGQVEAYKGDIIKTEYTNSGGKVTIVIKYDKVEVLKEMLVEKTGNKVDIEDIDTIYK